GVAAAGGLVGGVVEVRLDGVAAVALGSSGLGGGERILPGLGRPAEPEGEFGLAPVAQVPDPPGEAHPPVGPLARAGVVVVAAPEGRGGPDGPRLPGAG